MTPKQQGANPTGEHPLMSDKTLRTIYAGMLSARAELSRTLSTTRVSAAQTAVQAAAIADVACFASTLVGLDRHDLAFGCRTGSVLSFLHLHSQHLPLIPRATDRLYAAIGATLSGISRIHSSERKSRRIVTVFFDRHEVAGRSWLEALKLASACPILLIVLPRWTGKDDSTDIGRESRQSEVPGIPVDADDPIALYRVAQESLVRARADGKAALIEAIRLPAAASTNPDPIARLKAYLLRRGIADEMEIERVATEAAKPARKRRR